MQQQSAQQYLDEMTAARGYVLSHHKILIGADFEFARAANELVEASYLRQRKLDRRTKELLCAVSIAALGGSKENIQVHIRNALKLGVDADEILEALELLMPEGGTIIFQRSAEAWAEVVGARPLEPSDGVGQSNAGAASDVA